jgi:hypothetical protein
MGVFGYHAAKKMKRQRREQAPELSARGPRQGASAARPSRSASQTLFPTPIAGPMKSGGGVADPDCLGPPRPVMAYPDDLAQVGSRCRAGAPAGEGPPDPAGPFAPPSEDGRPQSGLATLAGTHWANRTGALPPGAPDIYARPPRPPP